MRAPIAENGGYAWFANRGIGRPVAESLRATMDWFRSWLDDVAPAGRPVVLIGFSGGAAFAGGLVLDDPARYAGAAILCGTLPVRRGPADHTRPPDRPTRLRRARRRTTPSSPATCSTRTWDYLLGPSGAPIIARRDPVGHTVAAPALADLARWVRERLAFLIHRG